MKAVKAVVLVLLLVVTTTAFGWNFATHAIIADRIAREKGRQNLNEIYGAVSPDMFNLLFSLPVYVPGGIYEILHYRFMDVWDAARTRQEMAAAVGFWSHNDECAADFTAHHAGALHGTERGYVIEKAEELGQTLGGMEIGIQALIPEIDDAVALELYHSVLECALDVLAKRIDPHIGKKLISAARSRTGRFPKLILRAFADDLEPLLGGTTYTLVVQVEARFRKSIVEYGRLFRRDEETILATLSERLAAMAAGYLASYDLTLPEGVDLEGLVATYLATAIDICEPDFAEELAATIAYLESMVGDGVKPCGAD